MDPRDTQWEDDAPAYRVYLWHRPPPPDGVRIEDAMWHCDEHRLTGAEDVAEVIAWAQATARPDQSFTVHVEHRDGDRPGLIRLMGVDPTAADEGVG